MAQCPKDRHENISYRTQRIDAGLSQIASHADQHIPGARRLRLEPIHLQPACNVRIHVAAVNFTVHDVVDERVKFDGAFPCPDERRIARHVQNGGRSVGHLVHCEASTRIMCGPRASAFRRRSRRCLNESSAADSELVRERASGYIRWCHRTHLASQLRRQGYEPAP